MRSQEAFNDLNRLRTRAFVTEQGTATIVCPNCQITKNITVADWSKHGVHIKRTNNIIMDQCDIQYNGSAGGLHHNVYFLYNKYLLQSDCDMSFPVKGKGNKYTSFEYVIAQRCTIRD